MGVEPKINSPALLEAKIWSKMYNISGGHLEMQYGGHLEVQYGGHRYKVLTSAIGFFLPKNMGAATEQLISKCHGCKDISKNVNLPVNISDENENRGSHISSDLTNFPNFPGAGLFFGL